MKPIAIATADLHINNWKAYSKNHSRLSLCLQIFDTLCAQASKLGVPLLIAGDLFHLNQSITNRVLLETLKTFRDLSNTPIYAISGNHDMSENNTKEKPSPSFVRAMSYAFPNIKCMDFTTRYTESLSISGIPYLHKNVGFKEALLSLIKNIKISDPKHKICRILMLHGDFPKAQTTMGHVFEEVDNMPKNLTKLLTNFDWVLYGHIHMPQRLTKNTYMLGAPYQQTWGDSGCETGYWEIYKDHKPKFVPLDTPKFIRLKEGETPPEDSNFYSHSSKKDVKLLDINMEDFDFTLDKTQLAKNYLKATGETDKYKRKALLEILKVDHK